MAIQLKRSLSSNIDQNYLLAQGQLGIEMPATTNSSATPFKMKIGDGVTAWKDLPYHGDAKEVDVSGLVPVSRTINGKNLSANITLTADDVSARSSSWMPNASDVGALPISGTAVAATKLATARYMRVNLATTDDRAFDGTENITMGVVGVLPIPNGGTGATSLAQLKSFLGIDDSSGSGSIETTAIPALNGATSGVGAHIQMVICDKETGVRYTGAVPDNFTNTNTTILHSNRADNRIQIVSQMGTGPNLEIDVQNVYNDAAYGNNTLIFNGTGLASYGYNSSNAIAYSTLGSGGTPWKAVYAQTGTIQSSDRSTKHAIHYLSDAETTTISENGQTVTAISLSDVMQFIQAIEPATFLYDDPNNDAENMVDPINRQLGLIADDVESTTLFPYIGARVQCDAIPERLFDDSTTQHPAIPANSVLTLQPIPLAVTALTACKYLLQRLELIEEQIAS